ncbi:hypothetical protein [Cohnella sp. GCM10027633]|uniref:hypothetical protein n=1 Tax=unclassified Cohnella TaxID=2636738 RepID=UPI00362BCF57
MKSKKMYVAIASVCIASAVILMSNSNSFAKGEQGKEFHIKSKYTNLASNEFDTLKGKKAAEDKIGLTENNKSKTKFDFDFSLKGLDDVDKSVEIINASGRLKIDNENFELNVNSDGSYLQKSTLANGMQFIFGSVDAYITTKKGQTEYLTLGLNIIPETNQTFITTTLGSIDSDFAVLSFGDNFLTNEMIEKIKR